MRAEQLRISQWKAPRKAEIAKLKSPSARTKLRAQLKKELDDEISAGRLIITHDALIAPAVEAELDALGWGGPYEPLPLLARGGGRRWGSTAVHGDRRHQIAVRLDDKLHDRLQRACYHEQIDLVNQLEAFYETYGDSPDLPDGRPGEEPDALAARYRDELRAEILTAGDVMRAALDRVIGVTTATIGLAHEQHDALCALLVAERERARRWWRQRKETLKAIRDPVTRKRALARCERDYHQAVETGELVVTTEGFILPAINAELEARGWTKPYAALPHRPSQVESLESVRHTPTSAAGHRIRIRIPGAFRLHLERACYWERLGTHQEATLTELLHAAVIRAITSTAQPGPHSSK